MSELLIKITDKLKEKATKFGFKGTDSVHVSLILTEDEEKEFSNMKWDSHYCFEFKNNVLHVNYVEELRIYCAQFEKKYNATKLEKKYGKFELEGKAIYQIEDAGVERAIEGYIYRAYAIDETGKLHFIIWKEYGKDSEKKVFINDDGKVMGPCSDRENACDWTSYIVEEVIF